ncbi:hypothetical protein, partial [Aeromonas dhakensis]
ADADQLAHALGCDLA